MEQEIQQLEHSRPPPFFHPGNFDWASKETLNEIKCTGELIRGEVNKLVLAEVVGPICFAVVGLDHINVCFEDCSSVLLLFSVDILPTVKGLEAVEVSLSSSWHSYENKQQQESCNIVHAHFKYLTEQKLWSYKARHSGHGLIAEYAEY